MRKLKPLRVKWRNLILPLTVSLIAIADQLSKAWVRANLAIGESVPESGLFHFTHVRNTGAAFGLFSGHSQLLMAASISAVVILLIYAIFIYRRLPMLDHVVVKVGTGLILGGTLGNLIDRMYFGYVTDFIGVGTFPIFNIADSCITAGVIVFACFLIVQAKLMDVRDEQCV